MQRKLPYRVVLPENYRDSGKKYPVLYLLHGLFGCCENWLEFTKIIDFGIDKDFIIVLPDGSDGWYTDSATIENDKFESSFIGEFIPEIEGKYRIIENRGARAVAGLSMGGFGALKFAFKRPDLFVFAGSMSGAFDAPRRTKNDPGFDWENLGPSISKTFGEADNPVRADNDLFEIIKRKRPEDFFLLPYLYIDCGIEDGFLSVNRELAGLLARKHIDFEYHESSGGHDWSYWNRQTEHILKVAAERFKPVNN